MLNGPLRPPILRSLAWQVMAELWRRHSAGRELTVIETHPGSSLEGQVSLLLDWTRTNTLGSAGIVFNIGGPAGTYQLQRRGLNDGEAIDFVAPLLTTNPVLLVDEIEGELELATPRTMPISTPAVLAVRTIAAALTTQCLTVRPLSVTMGWVDMSIGPQVPLWTESLDATAPDLTAAVSEGETSWESAFRRVAHLSALHRDTGEGPLLDAETPFVGFDWHAGVMVLGGDPSGERINLMRAYQQAGGALSPLVARALVHLGC